jgi:hypothetical protein
MPATIVPVLADIVAITLVASLYFHRHQRRDLLLAYVALNVGVLAVTTMLASAPVGAGLGLGLFGILSIIRLRSDSITQEEIAYYFIALALGLVAGLHPEPVYVVPALSGLLVLVMYLADHPRLFARSRRQLVTLDSAIANEAELRSHLQSRLGAEVRHLIVQELDFVRDLTVVDVRLRRSTRRAAHASPVAASSLPGSALPASAPNLNRPLVNGLQHGGSALAPADPVPPEVRDLATHNGTHNGTHNVAHNGQAVPGAPTQTAQR